MKIKFSRHAKRQMKWRKISENELRVATTNPDRLEDTIQGRKNAFKNIKGRLLKITYKHENDSILIITAISKGE
jgi:ABC-type uncharacterized transport system substrate-binding protein